MKADLSLLASLHRTWQKFHFWTEQDPILVAISGGADSVWLAYALRQAGQDIALAHVNYGLRKEAAAEEALVRAYTAEWQVPLYVLHTDPKAELQGDSLQMQARRQRYAFFDQLMAEHGYGCCATAHHADDQAETLLMSLLDGNSRQVWRGIPARRGAYVRPLLTVRKTEIRAALAAAGLAHGEDHTNALPVYRRNQLRVEILPQLEALAPALPHTWTTKWAREQRRAEVLDALLAEKAAPGLSVTPDECLFDWSHLLGGSSELLTEILAYVLEHWGLHGHQLWAGVALVSSASGHWIDTDQGRLTKGRQQVHLGAVPGPTVAPAELDIHQPGTVRLGPWEIAWRIHPAASVQFDDPAIFWLAVEALKPPLRLRPWAQGDRMMPLGMQRPKKISDILIDTKVPPWDKAQVPVLEDATGIVALVGFRIAERVRVGEEAQVVLRVEMRR